MNYEHDVFLSFSRDKFIREWALEYFLPSFQLELGQEMGRQPRIFADFDIRIRSDWPAHLAKAVMQSRCMVAIWTPSYFQSSWCQHETLAMLRRQKISSEHEGKHLTLLYAVLARGGDTFPDYVKDIPRLDLRSSLVLGRAFRETDTYQDFHQALKNLAKVVATGLGTVPPFSESWLDLPVLELPEPGPNKIALPTLG